MPGSREQLPGEFSQTCMIATARALLLLIRAAEEAFGRTSLKFWFPPSK
jgi:hypothetical protein